MHLPGPSGLLPRLVPSPSAADASGPAPGLPLASLSQAVEPPSGAASALPPADPTASIHKIFCQRVSVSHIVGGVDKQSADDQNYCTCD